MSARIKKPARGGHKTLTRQEETTAQYGELVIVSNVISYATGWSVFFTSEKGGDDVMYPLARVYC